MCISLNYLKGNVSKNIQWRSCDERNIKYQSPNGVWVGAEVFYEREVWNGEHWRCATK